MAKDKLRLDALLVDQGFFSGREKAKAAIMAGEIKVNGVVCDKASQIVSADAAIEILGAELPYVSRGGLKLAKAIDEFGLDLNNKIIIDLGASTGGFVDCALQNGAAKVYAVDVGYGQLAWKLRQDPRVVVMERTNARYLSKADIDEPMDMITADLSFISLQKAIPAAVGQLLGDGGELVALIKPQFEAGRDKVGKKGVVRDAATHIEVINNIIAACTSMGLQPLGLSFSPVTGPNGNIEYLIWARKSNNPATNIDVNSVVESAWLKLTKNSVY